MYDRGRIVSIPLRITDKIYDSVRNAIWSEISPQEFLDEVLGCWKMVLEEKKQIADRVFSKRKTQRSSETVEIDYIEKFIEEELGM